MPPPRIRPEAHPSTAGTADQNNAATQTHTSGESSVGESPGAPATSTHTLTLDESRQLLIREGLDFKIPPFLKDRPPLPLALQGLDADQLSARIEDMPDGEDRAAVQKYLTWKTQDDTYQALVDRHTQALANMIHSGERKDHVMEVYDGYKRVQKIQRDAVQVMRHARENGVFSLSTQGMDYLSKSQFQWKRMRFGKNGKDVKNIKEIEQKKADFEAELAQLSNNRPISMATLRNEHSARQKTLNEEIKKAVDDKLHRLGEHGRRRNIYATTTAMAVAAATAIMYWERILGVGGAKT
ncbi:hypothetical protein DWU98_18815 [Dyella monticola]|uniref:Uncharacterized protein n=2 Tax=Dyella monticola TaxID=1927958 RepID=A0A370WTD4_9GAMM|nr:hypothetical protein DWU98_18815 [Dyella monticola]